MRQLVWRANSVMVEVLALMLPELLGQLYFLQRGCQVVDRGDLPLPTFVKLGLCHLLGICIKVRVFLDCYKALSSLHSCVRVTWPPEQANILVEDELEATFPPFFVS